MKDLEPSDRPEPAPGDPATIAGRIVGPAPAKTAIKLVVASIFVGGVLAVLNISPVEFWRGLAEGVGNLLGALGDSAAEILIKLGSYLALGAMIVVPVFLVMRLLKSDRNRR